MNVCKVWGVVGIFWDNAAVLCVVLKYGIIFMTIMTVTALIITSYERIL